jgi:hypothetical protein
MAADGVSTTNVFKYQGNDKRGANTQDNQYPQKWEDPHYPTGKYSPDMQITYHADGTYYAYDPVKNTEVDFHTSGHQKIRTADAYIENSPYETFDHFAGHRRQFHGGHHDPSWNGHQRENFQGGRSSVHKGDVFDFYAGNHAVYHAGSSRTELAGGAHETRLTNDASHTMSIMHGSDMQSTTTMTKDNHWRATKGNINDQATGNISSNAAMNMIDTAKQNWTANVGQSANHSSQQDWTIKSGTSVVLQAKGGMKIPAIMPPSVEVKKGKL